MLSKAAVRPNAVCGRILLYDDLIMNFGKRICDKGLVPGAEALIEADLGNIQRICACQEPNTRYVCAESSKSPKSDAAATCNLGH